MKLSVRGNVVTLETGIPEEYAEDKLILKDKDDVKFEVKKTTVPYISKFGLGCNAVIDGKLAVLFTVDEANPKELKRSLGEAVVAANAFIPEIMTDVELKNSIIDEYFDFQ